ncbi:MAG: transposase [Candidatus Competibacteraceae bacterium]|nr:transposase [Candidatus Competibacteraceae bacterium]
MSEGQGVAEVARQRGVNENQVCRWKKRFLDGNRQRLNRAKVPTADQ